MITHDTILTLWLDAALLVAGFALGTGYFASLRHGLELSVARRACSPYMLLALARLAAAALFFTFAVRWGLPPLLAAFVGFLAARQLALHSARKVA